MSLESDIADLEAKYNSLEGYGKQQLGPGFEKQIAEKKGQLAQQKALAGDRPVEDSSVSGGFLGLGSDDYKKYGINEKSFADPGYGTMRDHAYSDAATAKADATRQIKVNAATGQAATIDTNAANQARGLQTALGSQLLAASQGQGPSAAQAQMGKATDAAVAQQLGLAASSRGNPAIALRNAAANTAQITQGAATDSAVLRAQEIQSAQGQLGALSTNLRGQDIGLASDQAQLNQQMGLANLGNQQQSNMAGAQLSEQHSQFQQQLAAQYMAGGMNAEQARIQALQDYQKFGAQLLAQQEAAKHNANFQGQQGQAQVVGAIGQAVAGGIMKAAL